MTDLPNQMNAFVLMRHGGLDALEFKTDWPMPQAKNREVLIKVAACGMNNTDVNTRSGWYSKAVDEEKHGQVADVAARAKVPERRPIHGGDDILGSVANQYTCQ